MDLEFYQDIALTRNFPEYQLQQRKIKNYGRTI